MPRNVTIKFKEGEPHTYKNVPDNVSVADVKKKATAEFPNRVIVGVQEAAAAPVAAKPTDKPSVDIDQSSEKPAAGEPEQKDYRANFPDRYTPPGFIRNKRGELVYY
jgi:hypothetical protein